MSTLAILIIPVGLGATGFMVGYILRLGSACKSFPDPKANHEHDDQREGETVAGSDAVV